MLVACTSTASVSALQVVLAMPGSCRRALAKAGIHCNIMHLQVRTAAYPVHGRCFKSPAPTCRQQLKGPACKICSHCSGGLMLADRLLLRPMCAYVVLSPILLLHVDHTTVLV